MTSSGEQMEVHRPDLWQCTVCTVCCHCMLLSVSSNIAETTHNALCNENDSHSLLHYEENWPTSKINAFGHMPQSHCCYKKLQLGETHEHTILLNATQ